MTALDRDISMPYEGQNSGNPFRGDQLYMVSDLQRILHKSREWINKAEKSGRIPPSVNFPALGKHWPGRHLMAWYDKVSGGED